MRAAYRMSTIPAMLGGGLYGLMVAKGVGDLISIVCSIGVMAFAAIVIWYVKNKNKKITVDIMEKSYVRKIIGSFVMTIVSLTGFIFRGKLILLMGTFFFAMTTFYYVKAELKQ